MFMDQFLFSHPPKQTESVENAYKEVPPKNWLLVDIFYK